MTIVLRLVAASVAALVWLPDPGLAEPASPWASGFHSRARLVSGWSDGADHWLGVEILLDPGYKTYWRDPGESGLPPRFDWTGSSNAQAIDLSWPAPTRTEDVGGIAHAYTKAVVFPVRVRADRPDKPVVLQLELEYGVCKEICIPAQAALALEVAKGDGAHRGLVKEALARVPRPQPVGAEGPLAIAGLARLSGEKPSYRVDVRSPEGATLFAELPEGWYVSTSTRHPSGHFTVTVDERPKDAAGPVPLRLTLAAEGHRAIETEVSLDPTPAAR